MTQQFDSERKDEKIYHTLSFNSHLCATELSEKKKKRFFAKIKNEEK